jgi:UDP-N-acetylmuramyl tripeptide synthase
MKKPKLLETSTASFQNLPEECVVRVLEFLELDDLDAVTMCSYVCCCARLYPSLNQKRQGVIICSDDTLVL